MPYPQLVGVALAHRAVEQDGDRFETAEAWEGETRGAGLVSTGRYGTPIDPRTVDRRVDDDGDPCERQLDGDQRTAAQARRVPQMSTVAVLRCGTGQSDGPTIDGAGPVMRKHWSG